MDNLPAHKVAGIREAIVAVGATLVYLSPYSLDFSPIENYWSNGMGEFLRAHAARTACARYTKPLRMHSLFVTTQDIKGLFTQLRTALGAAIKRTLNQEKYVVDWVLDGTEAWHYLENQWTQYTLAIFDWLLPGLSGLELCLLLRNQSNPLPILMLTARNRMEDKVAGLDAGANDYMCDILPTLIAKRYRAGFSQRNVPVSRRTPRIKVSDPFTRAAALQNRA